MDRYEDTTTSPTFFVDTTYVDLDDGYLRHFTVFYGRFPLCHCDTQDKADAMIEILKAAPAHLAAKLIGLVD